MAEILFLRKFETNTVNKNDEGLTYLKKLFQRCTNGHVEIRPLPVERDRQWIQVNNITTPAIPKSKDIYVGVATREEGKGGKKDIIEIPAVWVDIDFKNTSEEEARKKIEEFDLEPSMIARSGDGFHLYYILNKPAKHKDIEKIEAINKKLADYFGGDMAAVEAARILRLPGTYNYKYNPPRPVTLESVTNHLYSTSDFDFLPPAVSDAMTTTSQPQIAVVTDILAGVREGERHTKAVSLASKYSHLGLSHEETQAILFLWNQQNKPPLPMEELNKTINDILNRYGKDNVSTITNHTKIIEENAMSIPQLIKKTMQSPPFIIEPWLRAGEIGMIYASRGVGKTMLALSIGLAATRRMSIGKWKTGTPTGCLFIDGEMAEYQLQSRIMHLQKALEKEQAPFKLLSADNMRSKGETPINLTKPEWRNALLDYINKHDEIKLVIMDNLASLTPGIDENIKKDWDDINYLLLQLRAKGVAVIMIHHTGKNDKQRGTSGREDPLDFSIQLKRPPGYMSEEGAKFIVEFKKNRGLFGDAVKPLSLTLINEGHGYSWEEDDSDKKTKDTIIERLNDGKKQKDIAKELDVSEPYVTQVKKKAKKEGRLNKTGKPEKKRQLPDLEEDIEEKKDQEIN